MRNSSSLARVTTLLLVVLVMASLAGSAAARGQTGGETLTGTLHVVYGDPQPGSGGIDRDEVFLIDAEGNVTTLSGLGDNAGAFDRQQVTVRGADDGAGFHVTGVEKAVGDDSLYWQAQPLSGPQHWLTILCTFPGANPATQYPREHFEGLLSNTEPGMGHYWNEVSYGKISIVDPVVTDWYTLPHPASDYAPEYQLDLTRTAEDCTAAADADVDFTEFDGIALVLNDSMGNTAYGGSWYLDLDGESRAYGITWLPIFGYEQQNIFAHEMGHAFGLPHSSGGNGFAYDSFWDLMSGGGTCYQPHLSYYCIGDHTIAVYKDVLGWIPPARRYIAESPSDRTITLTRLAQPVDDGYLLALIPIQGSETSYYSLEARLRVGYDTRVPGDAVIIHHVDLTTWDQFATVVDVDGNQDPNDAGAMWTAGETFRDEANDIEVTIEEATTTGFRVTISNHDAFWRTWARTDKPVSDVATSRTWMWGPDSFTGTIPEPYVDAPSELRGVRYYDKSRMEVTDPTGDPNSVWYVTNGLLVMELVTGQMQIGDSQFDQRTPAAVNVAGDADDATGPTYATIARLLTKPALADGATITQRVDRAGNVSTDPALGGYDVTAAERVQVPGIDLQVASVFWAFMNSSGPVWEGNAIANRPLFENPFYATGYPIAEAYWATVKVGGTPHDVLLQCFERRCLTYTPDNPDGWKVEAGNVGQHYYRWRYAQPEFDGQIAFTSDRAAGSDIYLVNDTTQFNEPLRLTDDPADDTTPAISPDGSRIAFASYRDGAHDLYVMDIDGDNLERLTFDLDAEQPAWSPDGSRIAFVAGAGRDDAQIWVMDADGSNPTQLTDTGARNLYPTWSADGASILFTAIGHGNFDIHVMDSDGGNPHNLTNTADINEYQPAVSPDGTLVAFERVVDGENAEIYVMDFDGSNQRNLSNHPAWDSAPAWSPDSSQLVFVSQRIAGGADLYLMRADGTDQRNLTNHPGMDLEPSWGP
jgi:M6 family metalloprotease-like protein